MQIQANLVVTTSKDIVCSRSIVEMIEQLPVGKYRIVIEEQASVCTVPQKRLLWMWFTYLAREFGTPKAEWYTYYCNKFLESGEHSIKGMTSSQLAFLMMQVQADVASEFGIQLPQPGDDNYNYFVREYSIK